MPLPQIQQARIIQAPGVFDYAMREGPNLAQAFTAGLASGQRARESKQRAKEVEVARGDRITERNQAAMERFGADAVVDPESGTVDVMRSAGAARDRGQLAKLAEQAGEAEAMGLSMADLPPQAREMPEYKVGLARGLAKSRQEDMMLERIGAREDAMQKRQLEVERVQQEGLNRRQMEENNSRFVSALMRPAAGGGRSGDGSDTSVRYTDPESGAAYTFKSQEAFDKWRGRDGGQPAATSGDPDFEKAAREAIKEYDALKGRGVGADLEFDSKGIPTVSPSSFWDTATDETIGALRRKVEPKQKPSGLAPVPLRAL